MGLRRLALAPLYHLAGWIDDNPVRAVALVIAAGAVAVFLLTLPSGAGPETGSLAFDSATAGVLAETARERPAYLAAAIAGLAVALLYDG